MKCMTYLMKGLCFLRSFRSGAILPQPLSGFFDPILPSNIKREKGFPFTVKILDVNINIYHYILKVLGQFRTKKYYQGKIAPK